MQLEASETANKALFIETDCDAAFYVFKKDNPFRQFIYRLINYKMFDHLVMLLIFLSSVKLAVDTYLFDVDPDGSVALASYILDMFFNITFIFEMVLK